jgi:glycosyltransferase involved in cell wall biosynthesis
MAVRDGAKHLRAALGSVSAQKLDNFELIVVDDGSTDETPSILGEFAREDGRTRVLREPRAGIANARNVACRAARGRYLAILDADDLALPERLELQVAFLDSHPGVAVVGGAGIFIDEAGRELCTIPYPQTEDEVTAALYSGRSPLINSAATMRKAAFEAIGGYRRAMEVAQDYDLWLRIVAAGGITNLAQPVVRYRIHSGHRSTRRVEKTARATSAALAAARIRASGRPDPLDAADALDANVLERLGVSDADIATQEVVFGLWLARLLSKGGRFDEAAELWRHCVRRAGASATPARTRAAVLRARADAGAAPQLPLTSVALRLWAAVLDPKGALERVRGGATAERT